MWIRDQCVILIRRGRRMIIIIINLKRERGLRWTRVNVRKMCKPTYIEQEKIILLSLSLSKLFRSRCLPLGMFRSNTCPISDSSDTQIHVADLDHSLQLTSFNFVGPSLLFFFFLNMRNKNRRILDRTYSIGFMVLQLILKISYLSECI